MFVTLCKSKIHRAVVTDANLDYEGSVTIDGELLAASGILRHERVQIVNINNGARLETYVIEGEAGSGVFCLNGAAARLCACGDNVIVIAYAIMSEEEAASWQPTIVMVDSNNHITAISTEGSWDAAEC